MLTKILRMFFIFTGETKVLRDSVMINRIPLVSESWNDERHAACILKDLIIIPICQARRTKDMVTFLCPRDH